MELDNLGSAESFTISATRLPMGKFSVRSGTSNIETAILADRVLGSATLRRGERFGSAALMTEKQVLGFEPASRRLEGFLAWAGPMPRIRPDERYFSMPSAKVIKTEVICQTL